MGNPRLSIITLVYNQAPFLKERIRSVCSQTFQDFEWIVLDDCSTDNSAEILRRELTNVPQLKRLIFHKKNLGVHFSYNEALTWCEGDFVARAEGDDSCSPDFFEKTVRFLCDNPSLGFVHTAYQVVTAEGRSVREIYSSNNNNINSSHEIFKRLALGGNFICSPSVVFQRPLYETVGGMSNEWIYAGDYELWLKLSAQYDVGYIAEPLVDWRRLPQAISKRGTISVEGATEPYRVLNKVFANLPSEQDHLHRLQKKAIRSFSTRGMVSTAFYWLVYRRNPLMALTMLKAANEYDPGVWITPSSYLAAISYLAPLAFRRLVKGYGGTMDFLPR